MRRSRKYRYTRIVLLAVIFSLCTVSPARAGGGFEPPYVISIGEVVSPPANEYDWHKAGVTAHFRVNGVTAETILDDCQYGALSISPEFPSWIAWSSGVSFVPAADCYHRATVLTTRQERVSFYATTPDGGVGQAAVTLQVDLDHPSVGVTTGLFVSSSSGLSALQGASGRIEGTVSDGFSGPHRVELKFTDTLGIWQTLKVAAICEECVLKEPCEWGASGVVCGRTAAWRADVNVPPGRWTVTPYATDFAGNTAAGDPVVVLVL